GAMTNRSAVTTARAPNDFFMANPSFRHQRFERPQREREEHDVEREENPKPHDGRRVVRRRLEERRRPSHATNDDRNRDRIHQDRQQHVARARPYQHRREERADGGEPDRAAREQQQQQQGPREQRRREQQRDERHEDEGVERQ